MGVLTDQPEASDPYEGRDGLVLGMDEDEYHGGPEFSSSAAKEILKTPANYKYVYLDGHREKKKAWDVGTAIHTKVLGVGQQAVAYPEEVLSASGAANTNASRDWRAKQEAAGLIVVKQAELDQINGAAEAVLAHPGARLVLEQDFHPEASMFATDPDTGIRVRVRFDILTTSLRYAGDLKSTEDASPIAVKRAVKQLKYHVQREFYDDVARWLGIELAGFPFIFVEKKPPYLVSVWQFDEDLRDMGKREAAHARELLLRCRESNSWPGYGDEIQLLKPLMAQVYDFQDEYESETPG